MSAFMPDFDVVTVSATTTLSNVAVPTSGPATFNVTNAGSNPVIVGFTQGDAAPSGNVVIPAGWPMMIQAQNPERTPGTVYAWVTTTTGSSTVYISSGFEV